MCELWYCVVLAGIGFMGAGVFVLVMGMVACCAMLLEDET